MSGFRMCPVGDQAILCEFGNKIDEKINDDVQALTRQIKSASLCGVVEILPTYRSLLVFYDSSRISYKKLSKKISGFHRDSTVQETGSKKIRIVPCLYGGEYGPDLSDMADQLGMSETEIINIHKSVDYKIYMLGFLPGFVYLGGLDERIHMPRLDVPRTKIPERSVGIGGNQTGIYPMESPGGWRLIGSTPLNFYNPVNNPPVLCEAGEYIRFEPVTVQEYQSIRRDVERGSYKAEFV